MGWDKVKILRDNGQEADAQAPIIISASRSTDIPAFYPKWLANRFKEGLVCVRNPFNPEQVSRYRLSARTSRASAVR